MNKFKNHLIALTAVRRIDMRTKVHFATTLTTLLLLLFTSVGPYLPPPAPSASAAGVNVLHVPRDFATIQAAVDAAGPGDVIHVAEGTYNENVVVTTSDLRLHASAGAVLDGTGLTGNGLHVLGTVTAPVIGIEVAGFEVRNFERGIVVEQATHARISRNEVHHSLDKVAPLDSLTDAVGIDLRTVRFSEVSQNFSHDNGVAGLQVRVGSTRNVIRANRLNENGSQLTADWSGKGILLTGPSNDNTVLENEALRNSGWGIVISRPAGLAPLTGTFVAQNDLHHNARAGISLMGAVSGNVILNNNAAGNSVAGYTLAICYPFDLFDQPPVDNTWEGNKGTSNF
ncbi:MAG: right-handed parallel beta-helix repeat-containing protein [Pyrinomonadaceae bacterium]|nr:right-handed parallel beta-helix repeat-containing protein [Pyrinomonadaceae bacterium]